MEAIDPNVDPGRGAVDPIERLASASPTGRPAHHVTFEASRASHPEGTRMVELPFGACAGFEPGRAQLGAWPFWALTPHSRRALEGESTS